MSGLNIVRRFVGCRQLQGFCGPLVARRASTTIRQRNLNNDGHGSSDLEGPRKKASFASRYVPTRDEFHRLTKNITVLKTHAAEFESCVKDLEKKFDQGFNRLLFLIVGSFLLVVGWDIYKLKEEHSEA